MTFICDKCDIEQADCDYNVCSVCGDNCCDNCQNRIWGPHVCNSCDEKCRICGNYLSEFETDRVKIKDDDHAPVCEPCHIGLVIMGYTT